MAGEGKKHTPKEVSQILSYSRHPGRDSEALDRSTCLLSAYSGPGNVGTKMPRAEMQGLEGTQTQVGEDCVPEDTFDYF